MTLLRRLAIRISDFVVRYAPTGTREWAAGLAGEVEAIDGDWAALSWAVGSLRVLFERPPGYEIPYDGIMKFVWIFGKIGLNIGLNVLIPLNAVLWMRKADCFADKIGWSLILLGWLYWDVSRLRTWMWERTAPPNDDERAKAIFGRAKLERRLQRARSVWRWLPIAVFALSCAGYAIVLMNVGGVGLVAPVVAVGVFFIRLMWMDSPARIKGQMERYDAVVAKYRWMENEP